MSLRLSKSSPIWSHCDDDEREGVDRADSLKMLEHIPAWYEGTKYWFWESFTLFKAWLDASNSVHRMKAFTTFACIWQIKDFIAQSVIPPDQYSPMLVAGSLTLNEIPHPQYSQYSNAGMIIFGAVTILANFINKCLNKVLSLDFESHVMSYS